MPIAGRTLSGERRTSTRAYSGTRKTYSNAGGGGTSTQEPSPAITIYGPATGGIGLAQTTRGYNNNILRNIMGFRAPYTGQIDSIRWYYLTNISGNPGYGIGTGGTMRVSLYNLDAGNLPTGAAIAYTDLAALGSYNAGRLLSLGSGWNITSGRMYCFAFDNTDASPNSNNSSEDFLWQPESSPSFDGAHTMGPKWADAEWFHKYLENGTWTFRRGYLPIIDVAMNGGQHFGQSYGEAIYGSQDHHGKVNGALEMCRARWTQGSTITVTGAYWRVSKESGTTQPLLISLRNSSDTQLGVISVAASAVATSAAPDGGSSDITLGQECNWVGGSFSSSVTLTAGNEYRLRLASAGGTYWTHLFRHLTATYGYHRSISWPDDGASEKTTDGSSWGTFGTYPGGSDFQFSLQVQ